MCLDMCKLLYLMLLFFGHFDKSGHKIWYQNMTIVKNGSKMNIFLKKDRLLNVFSNHLNFWFIFHSFSSFFFLNILQIKTYK